VFHIRVQNTVGGSLLRRPNGAFHSAAWSIFAPPLTGLRKGQASLEQQLERLTEAYLDGIVGLDEYRRRRSEGEQRRQALLRQQAQLEAPVNRQAEVANLALTLEDFCRRTTDGLAQATFEQKRQWWSCSSTVSWSPREKWRFVM
jgi:hypothetical protein